MDTSHNPHPHPDSIDVRQNVNAVSGSWTAGAFDARAHGLPYRAVRWKPEWPAMDDVPHAGSTVYVDGERRTVQTGVPTLSGWDEDGGTLGLDCLDDDGEAWWEELFNISLTPPAPERAEGEIVGTVIVHNGFGVTMDADAPDGVYVVIRRDS